MVESTWGSGLEEGVMEGGEGVQSADGENSSLIWSMVKQVCAL